MAAPSVRALLEQVLNAIQQTLGNVNEGVRKLEANMHTLRVLTDEVIGGTALVTPDRILRYEANVEMRAAVAPPSAVGKLCSFCSTRHSTHRRRFKWYVFTDGVLITRHREPWPLLTADRLSVCMPLLTEHRASQRRHSATSETAAAFDATITHDDEEETLYNCWVESEATARALVTAVHTMQAAKQSELGRAATARKQGDP